MMVLHTVTKLRDVASLLLAAAVITLAPAASAQDYPTRSIAFVVPFASGGGADLIGRVVGEKVGQIIGQPIVVENRPGAAAGIAAEYVAQAAPDGYTLLQGNIAHSMTPAMREDMPYDITTDFEPVTLLGSTAFIVAVNPDVPATTIEELAQVARERPGELNYASSGVGGSSHLAMELLKAELDIDIVHIPYVGVSQGVTDLIAGQVDVSLLTFAHAVPLMQSGQLRGLAVTSLARSSIVPDLPTVAESGVPNYEAAPWYAVMVPAGTPQPIIDKLYQAFSEALQDPEVQSRLREQGFDVASLSPAEFDAYLQAELEKWKRAVEFSGATLE